MRDAAIERLAKAISDPSRDEGRKHRYSEDSEFHFGVVEGWFSVFLVAAVLFTTLWCVQAAGWVMHIEMLSWVGFLGLAIGIFAAKQHRFLMWPVHAAVIVSGLLLSLWLTASADFSGSFGDLFATISRWTGSAFNGAAGDDSIFLLLILVLGFFLAYTSAWLVYHTRKPWLMIAANAVVLLINMNGLAAGYLVFLAIFLLAALLLLLRFNLYESMQRWRRQGLRYADDLGWDVMQAGSLISIGILVLSWLLPFGYENALAAQVWNANANPIVQIQNVFNRIITVSNGTNPANHGNFRDTLALGGNPNLNNDVVLTFQTDATAPSYLASVSYDNYQNGQWSIGHSDPPGSPVSANTILPTNAYSTHPVKQMITIVNPPGEQHPYLLGASAIVQVSQSVKILTNSGLTVAWVNANGDLTANTSYTVTSEVSSADVGTLNEVLLPREAPPYNYDPNRPEAVPPITAFEPVVVHNFTVVPQKLQKKLQQLAQKIVTDAGAKTMYQQAEALEKYLQSNYAYDTNIHPPSNQDPTEWFLFQSKRGFCNYFSSAMTLLARSLGIPARVIAGYTYGKPDPNNHSQYTVHGTDAHSWTQVYFAGYGWVDFEPSASFQSFTRPQPDQYSATSANDPGNAANKGVTPENLRKSRLAQEEANSGSSAATTTAAPLPLPQVVGISLGSLILLLLFVAVLFGLWWQRLFRHSSMATRMYGRVCLLANWAGFRVQPARTPYEYVHEFAVTALPTEQNAKDLERIGDIYVRERWADPQSDEHPTRNGEIKDLPVLWQRLQPQLFFYVLRHPHFLRWFPDRIGRNVRRLWRKRKERKKFINEF